MPRSKHDRERERKEDQEDDDGKGDPVAAALLGRLDGRNGERSLGRGIKGAVTCEHRAIVHPERAGVGAEKAANEDIARKLIEAIGFELKEDADGDARRLRQLLDRDLAALPFTSQILPYRIHRRPTPRQLTASKNS